MSSDLCQVPMPRYRCQVNDAKQLDDRRAVNGLEEVDRHGELLPSKLNRCQVNVFIKRCQKYNC